MKYSNNYYTYQNQLLLLMLTYNKPQLISFFNYTKAITTRLLKIYTNQNVVINAKSIEDIRRNFKNNI